MHWSPRQPRRRAAGDRGIERVWLDAAVAAAGNRGLADTGLDSVQPGIDDGHISESAAEAFRHSLAAAQNPAKRCVVLLHHHPAAVGTPLLDSCMLQNTERFWALMAEVPNLQLLLCGHVHGDYRLRAGEVPLEVCPATCFQWRKGTSELDTEDRRGYKLLEFDAAGFRSETVMF